MSYLLAPVAIISMAEQASPKVIGHMLDSRAQLMACSIDVVMTFSSDIPSSQPIDQPLSKRTKYQGRSTKEDKDQLILFVLCTSSFVLVSGCGCFGHAAFALFHGGDRLDRWRSNGAHPLEIAASPQVGEADYQYAKEDEDIHERQPAELAGSTGILLCLGLGVR